MYIPHLPCIKCGCIAFRHNLLLTGPLQMEMISSTCVDETFVARFMHASSSRILDTDLTVVVWQI